MIRIIACLLLCACAYSQYRTPAGRRVVSSDPSAAILPGGRMLSPFGQHYFTGPGSFGLAVSNDGNTIATADGGPRRYTVTILRREGAGWKTQTLKTRRGGEPAPDEDDWRSVFMGLQFADENSLYASEGNSGRVRLINLATGRLLASIDLNTGGYKDSYSGDLALDRERGLLYVVDQANFRLAVVDTRTRRVMASVRVGRLPFALALSADRKRAYVTNIGMFEYKALDGRISFPAFGFPSREAVAGTEREDVKVPGLGLPNVAESNSLAVVDVTNPARPAVSKHIAMGVPFGRNSQGGSSPSGIVVLPDGHICVTNGMNDSVTVVDGASLEVIRTVPLRVPGLERYRGILPVGIGLSGSRLLIAEAGINAVGVVDTNTWKVLGHIPAAWFPAKVAARGDEVFVANAKGFGTGANAGRAETFQLEMRRGALTSFRLPGDGELPQLTARVWQNNGFVRSAEESHVPKQIRHVVMIVKENRTFDEVFGDIATRPDLARYGRKVTPNHHEMARRWAIGSNFYADAEVSVDGHHWLAGSYPNTWTETSLMASSGGQKDFRWPTAAPGRLLFAESNASVHPEEQPEAGTLWHHLDRHKISFRNFGAGFELAGVEEEAGSKPTGARYRTNIPMPDPLYRNTSRQYPGYNMNIPDQYRADQLIAELSGMATLPRFIYIHLPNDHTATPRPEDGYPTRDAYVADNDYALGRVMEYLSRRPEWRSMAVLVTEDDAQGGVDSVDSHRTVLLLAGPWVKPGCLLQQNASFPSLLKTVFQLLHIPPLNLYDAAASDLMGCFTGQPDYTPFALQQIAKEVFDPAKARDPKDPKPGAAMDDPRELRREHEAARRKAR